MTAAKVREELARAFGLTLKEGPVSTGVVLTTPSTVQKELAVHIAKECALRNVQRDLGAVVAREIANEMQASNLRPADYADFVEISTIAQERLVAQLLKDPTEFVRSVAEHLRMRG